MKKLIAVILALVMMGSLAMAEDTAAAQDMMGRKFQFFLQRALEKIVSLEGGDAVLEVKDLEDEMLNARLQQKDGTVSLRARVRNGETFMIQANSEAVWALVNGQAVGIRFEELASLFQSAPIPQMPQADSRIYEVLFRLLAQETILKGIQTEQEGGTTRITVDLKATDMLKGLVQWMDDVLKIPQCKEAIVPVLDQILTAGGSSAGLEAQWPSIREELLAVETDARIAGEITTYGGTQVDGKLTLTEGETEYGLEYKTIRERETAGFQATLSGNGGFGPAADMLRLKLTSNVWTGNFRAELELAQEGSTLILNGTTGRDTLQLDLSGYPQEKIPFSAHLYFRNGGSLQEGYELRLDAANQQTRQDLSLNLNLQEGYQSFYLRTNQGWGGSQEISAVAQENRRGQLTYAALTAPGFSAVYEPGKLIIQNEDNKATVTGGYESDLVNVLNVVTESRYSSEPTRRQVRTEIAPSEEGRESVTCSVLDENGIALASLKLFADEQEDLPLISEMNPMMITKDMLQQMIR